MSANSNPYPQPPVPRYANGQPWKNARGQNAPREAVEQEFSAEYAVVDLARDPTAAVFLREFTRELRIRFYSAKSIKSYRSAITAFLRWYRGRLDQVTKQDVREFLDLLVTGGASSSHLSVTLSALRTAFDKFCLLRCTVGLVTPRKPKRLPVVLSKREVQHLIEAARSFRDKLLLTVLYATGLRVSEVSRLQWSDLDFDRRQIRVRGGKGDKDRYIMLAEHLLPLLRHVWRLTGGQGYLFPGEDNRKGRHLSPRTIERAVERARRLAQISKHVTPHTFRHSFATHLIEAGTDIRFIQKLLGHTHLETTTLYTKVATTSTTAVNSPLDNLHQASSPTPAQNEPIQGNPVGRLSFKVEDPPDATGTRRVALHVWNQTDWVALPGMTVNEPQPGWLNIRIPVQEVWEPALQRLTAVQVERIRSPDFYEILRREIARRIPPADP